LTSLEPQDLLRLRNLGRTSALEFLAHVIGLALDHREVTEANTEVAPQRDVAKPAPELQNLPQSAVQFPSGATSRAYYALEALERVAAWGAAEVGAKSVRDALDAVLRDEAAPREVRGFATWLGGLDALAFGARFSQQYAVEEALNDLEARFDMRSWAILEARILAVSEQQTLDELGRRYGVTRERVRQIESKAVSLLRDEGNRAGSGVLRRMAARVREELGFAIRTSQLTEMTFLGSGVDPVTRREKVLLWLAGPYRRTDGWLIRQTFPDLIKQTRFLLDQRTEHGPASLVDVRSALEQLGVRASEVPAWFEYVGGIRVFGDRVVRWSGSMADKAHAVLTLRGVPTARDELFALIGGTSPQSMANQLFGDARFKRTTLRHFGLVEWDHDEYTSVADEIREELERRGGEAGIDDLIRHIATTYHVAESSVRAYASGPLFVKTGMGRIRNRRDGEIASVKTTDAALTRGVYTRSDGWAWRTAVTTDLLRGSGAQFPTPVAAALGIEPGASKTFLLHGVPLWVGWPSLQASVGSLRVAATSAGASLGDELFLTLRLDGTAGIDLLAADELSASLGTERLARLVGVEPGEGVMDRIGVAIGLSFPPSPTIAALARRLTARKEPELAALLPAASSVREAPRGRAGDRFLDVLLDSLQD